MKKLLYCIAAGFSAYSCANTEAPKAHAGSVEQHSTVNQFGPKDEVAYLEIKSFYSKGEYVEINRLISQFYEFYQESVFTDSVKLMEEQAARHREQLCASRDSLSRLPVGHYIGALRLPRLDSITGMDLDVAHHHYSRDFTGADKKIFKNLWGENWYLSRQMSADHRCVTICRYRDCEWMIVLYSIGQSYQLIDSVAIFGDGCSIGPAPDFKYKQYLINEEERYQAAYFLGDTAVSVIDRTSFSLQDTASRKLTKEIGSSTTQLYVIDSVGRFKQKECKRILKDYVAPLYAVPL